MTDIDVREIGIVIDGLRKLRAGVLIQLIVGVIGVYISVFISIIINHILMFVIRTNFPWFLSRGILRNILEVAQHMAGFIFIMFVVSLVTIILSIIAIFGYIVPGASCLARWKSKFYPAIIFMKVGYIGGASSSYSLCNFNHKCFNVKHRLGYKHASSLCVSYYTANYRFCRAIDSIYQSI
ncbi:MAG: hypothetical protein QXK95_00180 [Nitrososphaerota archaeon]